MLRELYHAAANPDVARAFSNDLFVDAITEVEKSVVADKSTRDAARQLLARIDGMSTFEDAISNTQGNFARAAAALKDIGSTEQSFGNWLASMVTHQDLVDNGYQVN